MNIPNLSWKRLLVEGSAVVLSILLAFAIDAAWEQRQEEKADLVQLTGLYQELQSHKILLAEAIKGHRRTTEFGFELLDLISPEPSVDGSERISELLNGLMNFYQINAPFGSLNTAISSGTIARMQDVELASALASWPTIVDDLLEEQRTSAGLLITNLYARLGELVSMRDVYNLRFMNPNGRGTDELIPEVVMDSLTDKLAPPDYAVLFGNTSFAANVMHLMMMAQASEGEATQANQKLDDLMTQLSACLSAENC